MAYMIDFILHLDKHLTEIINTFGVFSYLIMFAVIFCETGLVVTPILPGDSFLFIIGSLSALGAIDIKIVTILLIAAAILGDSVNFTIGKYFGSILFKNEKSRFFKKEYLDKTHEFYKKHGGKTIIIARFVPIIRTFAPFVAGIGNMNFTYFISYNIFGGTLWICLFIFAGYFFGNIELVKNNFTIVIFAIIFISLLPGIYSYISEKYKSKNSVNEA